MTIWYERAFDPETGDVVETKKKAAAPGWPTKKCKCGAKVIEAFDVRFQETIVKLDPEPGSGIVGDGAFIVVKTGRLKRAYPANERDPESMRYRKHRCTAFDGDR